MSTKQKNRKQAAAAKNSKKQPAKPGSLPYTIPKWTIAVVLALTAVLYFRSVFNGFVVWDDDSYIIQNPFIREFSLKGISAIFSSFYFSNYHPLTTLTYLLEYSLFGENPLSYHLLNALFHLLNTWLVYKFIEKLSGNRLTALIVSLLFAVHPMHVESVAWVSERKDVLYTAFFLMSLIVYLRFTEQAGKAKYYIASLLLFVASLFSKSAAVTLPVILVAIDFYKGRKINLKLLSEKIPFLLLSLLFGILAILSQNLEHSITNMSLSYSLTERFFLLTYSLSFHLVSVVAPLKLSAMHYFPDARGGALPWQYYASLPFLLLLAWMVLRRSALRKEIVFGAFFFIAGISVMLQIVPFGYVITAERYSYVPYTGLFFIAGQWVSSINTRKIRNIAIFVLAAFVLIFSVQTFVRIGVWKDGITLFTDVIKKYPESYIPYWARANMKANKGDTEAAMKDYDRALAINPVFVSCLADRGSALNKLGDYAAALKDLNLALKQDTASADIYNSRGMANYGLGNINEALADFDKAIKLKPDLAEAYDNRGVAFYAKGDMKAALLDYDRAIKIKPDFGMAYYNRCVMKANTGDFAGALKDIDKAVLLTPGDAGLYSSRGFIRNQLKDTPGACSDWQKAISLGSKDAAELAEKYCR